MQINNNNYGILELIEMLNRKELVVNRDYQRGSGLWPVSARSYFIDTILSGFPFPKIYIYEFLDRAPAKLKKEIVDGQQRINTILGFYNDEFSLQAEGPNKGKRYSNLDDEFQERFLSYAVSIDVIRSANRSEILQMFRRMNAYTIPLNEAEKRHSSFHGEFKWFANQLADELNEFFVEFGVFTTKQITRMGDAALIADWILSIERGIISTSARDLRALYAKYDITFPEKGYYHEIITEVVHYIVTELGDLRSSYMMKPYALHSLFTALAHNKYGIPAIELEWEIASNNQFALDSKEAALRLGEMAAAHEGKESEGPYARYVWGCTSTVDRRPRRIARVSAIVKALGMEIPDDVYDDFA